MKAIVRTLYAYVPGLALLRFAIKELITSYLNKPEYLGLRYLQLGSAAIIDIGANRGDGVAAFRRHKPYSKVTAFEPNPQTAYRLALRYSRDRMVSVWSLPLGEKYEAVTFYSPRYGHWDCDGMCSTSYDEATEWLRDGGRTFFFNEAKLRVRKFAMMAYPLDDFGLAASLIKIHAQGDEMAILRGAQKTIEKSRPVVMCAFPTSEVDKLLTGWGYQAFTFRSNRFVPGIAPRPTTFTYYLVDNPSRTP